MRRHLSLARTLRALREGVYELALLPLPVGGYAVLGVEHKELPPLGVVRWPLVLGKLMVRGEVDPVPPHARTQLALLFRENVVKVTEEVEDVRHVRDAEAVDFLEEPRGHVKPVLVGGLGRRRGEVQQEPAVAEEEAVGGVVGVSSSPGAKDRRRVPAEELA